MHDFDYVKPRSVQELQGLIAAHRGAAKILAGGTDLIVQMRAGTVTPDLVIDVKDIRELNTISLSRSGLAIGGAVSCRTINEYPDIGRLFPALTDATGLIGGIQIQGRASIGGNLCNASPSADTLPPLIALSATAVIQGPGYQRELPVQDFCIGPGLNDLGNDEFLLKLLVPPPNGVSGARFLRFTARNEMDIAVASAAAAVILSGHRDRIESARIALGAVGPTPLLAAEAGDSLRGDMPSGEALVTAADLAVQAAQPIDDMRGSAEQRRHLVRVLVARALRGAIDRARGNQP